MPISFAFFSLIAVTKDGQCAIFEILFPCYCQKKLIHTKQKIIVDPTCFCFVTVCRPICDRYVCHTAIHEKICTTVSSNPNGKPGFTWLNNMLDVENTVTLNVQTEQLLEMKLYEQKGVVSTIVVDRACKALTLHNMEAIEIYAQGHSTVELMITWKKLKEIDFA